MLLGRMKPATPTTSLTATVIARCPSGIMKLNTPDVLVAGAREVSVKGDPALIFVIAILLSVALASEKDPAGMPAKSYWANTIGDKVLHRMTGLPVEDGQSGYRMIAARLLKPLRLVSRRYAIENRRAARRTSGSRCRWCRR